ncbi:MAG: histidine phosphatase family protein [Anaerolineae bacterium]
MKLLMARHGQSEWQVQGDVAGPDAPLTQLGEQQAHHLGKYLADHRTVTSVFCSHLRRAHRTAEIVASYLDLPVRADEDLREFEDWESGWTPDPISMWDPRPEVYELPGGYRRFRDRVRRVLRRLLEPLGEDESVLLIAHGGTIGTIWRTLLGTHTGRLWNWNAALHEMEWQMPGWGNSWVQVQTNLMEYLPPHMRTS